MPYGTKLDLTPAKTLYDYEFIKVDGLNKPIVSDGTVVTYYYKNKNEEHTHNLTFGCCESCHLHYCGQFRILHLRWL